MRPAGAMRPALPQGLWRSLSVELVTHNADSASLGKPRARPAIDSMCEGEAAGAPVAGPAASQATVPRHAARAGHVRALFEWRDEGGIVLTLHVEVSCSPCADM